MSIAFPALLIFLLVLPGIVLRHTYARGAWRWASPTSTTNLTDEIAYSVAFAVGLHLLWGSLADLLSSLEVDAQSVLVLLSGSYGPDNKYFEPAVASVSDHPVAITAYLLSLYASAAAVGYGAHSIVRKCKLDRRTRLLRFRNEWFYLLSGEVLEFEENNEEGNPPINVDEDVDGVYLTAVVDLADGSYIYRGVVSDFWFDKTGNLDRILLEAAERRQLSEDLREPGPSEAGGEGESIDTRYYPIYGDFFLLRYSETKTINLDYFYFEVNSPDG